MNQIKNLIEPTRLLLCWKSLQSKKKNYLVGEIVAKGDLLLLRYYLDREDFSEAKLEGFIGMPAFQPDKQPQEGFHQGVKEAFLRRVPPRARLDFPQYLEKHGLSLHPSISDFALLGYTEARLPGDGIFLVHPFDNQHGPLELVIEVVGVKNCGDLPPALKQGSELKFVPDQNNIYDRNAIAVLSADVKVGYINRCQTAQFHFWNKAHCQIHSIVHRLNGSQDHPRVFAFVEVLPLAAGDR